MPAGPVILAVTKKGRKVSAYHIIPSLAFASVVLNPIHKLHPRDFSFAYHVHTIDDAFQTAASLSDGMRHNSARIQESLGDLEPVLGKFPVFGLRLFSIRSLPIDRLIEHGKCDDPVRLYVSPCVRADRKRVKREVLAAIASDGCVADFHGPGIGDAVERIDQ